MLRAVCSWFAHRAGALIGRPGLAVLTAIVLIGGGGWLILSTPLFSAPSLSPLSSLFGPSVEVTHGAAEQMRRWMMQYTIGGSGDKVGPRVESFDGKKYWLALSSPSCQKCRSERHVISIGCGDAQMPTY